MALKFMMDQHVPGSITNGLRVRGVDALTAFEDGSHQLPDEALLQRATDLDRILVTQDDDLLAIAHHWQSARHEFAGLIYCHQLNITIGQAIHDLHLLATCCEPGEFQEQVQFLPL